MLPSVIAGTHCSPVANSRPWAIAIRCAKAAQLRSAVLTTERQFMRTLRRIRLRLAVRLGGGQASRLRPHSRALSTTAPRSCLLGEASSSNAVSVVVSLGRLSALTRSRHWSSWRRSQHHEGLKLLGPHSSLRLQSSMSGSQLLRRRSTRRRLGGGIAPVICHQ